MNTNPINPIEFDTVDDAIKWLRSEAVIIIDDEDDDDCSFCMWKAGHYTSDISYLADFYITDEAIAYKSDEFSEWLDEEFPVLFDECLPSDYEELDDEYGEDDDGRNTGSFDMRICDLRSGG